MKLFPFLIRVLIPLTLVFSSCGDPLVEGTYRGEALGQIDVLIHPYQDGSKDDDEWLSLDLYCRDEQAECQVIPDSQECRVAQNQCVQDQRIQNQWTMIPSLVSFSLIWVPLSEERGENKVLDYLKTHTNLPQSPLVRHNANRPFPTQEPLFLYTPPPQDLLSPLKANFSIQNASSTSINHTQSSSALSLKGYPSALGILVAYRDQDQDQKYTENDDLVGLSLDQGMIYIELPSTFPSVRQSKLALKRALLHRANFPFCSPPQDWILPASKSFPLTVSLMEVSSYLIQDELTQYQECTGGVSPQCEGMEDLNDLCQGDDRFSPMCYQCFDLLIDRACAQIDLKCYETIYEDDLDWDDLEFDLCFAMREACMVRHDCLQPELDCALGNEHCYFEEIAMCYQDSSCAIEVLFEREAYPEFIEDDIDPRSFVYENYLPDYDLCMEEQSYATWLYDNNQCKPSFLNPDAPTKDCAFKQCEQFYLECNHAADGCEQEYIMCILNRDPL